MKIIIGKNRPYCLSFNCSFRKEGKVKDETPTTARVIKPPNMTEGITPNSFAASPDSNAPISFEEPINILLTAETLPFISSGVYNCSIVCLITTLMLSNIPLKASAVTER